MITAPPISCYKATRADFLIVSIDYSYVTGHEIVDKGKNDFYAKPDITRLSLIEFLSLASIQTTK
jgi:hypothetical protein